jgi:8-oxo-dGTP pyrophosphatase MutT (NUDIX family)
MSEKEKNECSHRGKAMFQMSHAIRKLYSPKQFVIPLGIIIKDGKLLMSLRNDPHNKRYHNKWEFPGGGIDFKEDIRDCLVREVKEEVGYDVEIIKQFDYIHNFSRVLSSGFGYTAFLVPYLCKITGGDGVWDDNETSAVGFYDIDKALDEDVMEENDILIKAILPELKEYIENNK